MDGKPRVLQYFENGQVLIDRDIADWLIAERDERIRRANATADRLAADCDRYVAQHDADAATIAELRAQVEQAEACCGCDHGGHHVLPTPDATNPEHLRFAADVIEGLARAYERPSPTATQYGADMLRREAHGIERERVEVDATEKLIEKAARTIHKYGDTANAARALHAAGLLRDGGES